MTSKETARVAMLTGLKQFEIQSYQVPEIGDDEILVKVEGCGVCGTDGHEYARDPFGLIPFVPGHEGSGEIVKLGKNVTKDSAGKALAVGDKLVTCIIPCGECAACLNTPAKSNLCEKMGVSGLLPDDDYHFNGFFGDYIIVRKGATYFNVTGLDLDERLLVEPAAVAVHAVERAKTTGLIDFSTPVLVQGCGPIGLLVLSVIRAMGIENIIAVDGNDSRLELAKELGASETFNFTAYESTEKLAEAIQGVTEGQGAGFVFQCTGVPVAHANAWKFVKRGGGFCEVGFFMDGGNASINPHFDLCAKEITAVGSWVYTVQDYPITFDFLKRAKGIGLPLSKLITHRYPLSQITEALETNLAMTGIKVAVINDLEG